MMKNPRTLEKYSIIIPENIYNQVFDFFTERAGVFSKSEFIDFMIFLRKQ